MLNRCCPPYHTGEGKASTAGKAHKKHLAPVRSSHAHTANSLRAARLPGNHSKHAAPAGPHWACLPGDASHPRFTPCSPSRHRLPTAATSAQGPRPSGGGLGLGVPHLTAVPTAPLPSWRTFSHLHIRVWRAPAWAATLSDTCCRWGYAPSPPPLASALRGGS